MAHRSLASLGMIAGAALAAAQLLCAWSCATPYGSDGATDADGGTGDAATAPPQMRTVRIDIDWPSGMDLDPSRDARATKMRVHITDVADPSRQLEKIIATVDRGPLDLVLLAAGVVDVTVDVLAADDRLIGYGAQLRWSLPASGVVPVAVRKRILYMTSNDRGTGELRAFDLAAPANGEPSLTESSPPLPTLRAPKDLYVTRDGRLLVQTGGVADSTVDPGPPAISVVETGSHKQTKVIPLPVIASRLAPLGDGHALLALPSTKVPTTTFTLVDLDAATTTQVPTGLAGGGLVVYASSTSPDGTRVAVVADYFVTMTSTKPYLFQYDSASRRATPTDLSTILDAARGVRFMPDGKSILVAGSRNDAGWSTGALLMFDATATAAPLRTLSLETARTRVSGLLLHPDARHAYVTNEANYATPPVCCGEMRVIDLTQGAQTFASTYGGAGPEYELFSAVRLPYPPNRVIGGQSDSGNNVHGPFVELTSTDAPPATITTKPLGDIGSVNALATPFGSPL